MPLAKFISWFLAGLVAALFTASTLTAAEAEPAGQVIVASGTVQAIMASGAVRELRRRSSFYAGDTIRTASASQVQLRFADGALLSLRPDSELRVDEYRYTNHGGAGDRSVSTLLKGGLRTITGVIGKQDPQAYEVKTPVATIGVRGTHYEAVLESAESLVLAAWQGGIRVRNERGALDLGVGAAFNYGRAGREQPPQGLLQPPPALQASAPVGHAPPAASEQTEADSDATNAETNTGESSVEAGETANAPASDSAATDTGPTSSEPVVADSTAPAPMDTTLSAPVSTITDTGCATCAPPQQIVINDPTDVPAAQDVRFTAGEWKALQTTPYLGIWIEDNTGADFGFDGGRVLHHGSATPLFTENGYGPHEPQYATAPILDVVRIGKARVAAFGSYNVDTEHTVYWGTWDGTVNPVEIQIDPTNGAIKDLSYRPLYWATMLPTDPAAIAARTGSVSYNTVVAAHGGGSAGVLNAGNVSFNANVNFDTGAVTAGMLNIYNGPENWNVNFSGQVRSNVMDVKINTATSGVAVSPGPAKPIEGDMGFAFTGRNGQVLGGGFSLQAVGDPRIHAEGVLLVR